MFESCCLSVNHHSLPALFEVLVCVCRLAALATDFRAAMQQIALGMPKVHIPPQKRVATSAQPD